MEATPQAAPSQASKLGAALPFRLTIIFGILYLFDAFMTWASLTWGWGVREGHPIFKESSPSSMLFVKIISLFVLVSLFAFLNRPFLAKRSRKVWNGAGIVRVMLSFAIVVFAGVDAWNVYRILSLGVWSL